MRLHGRTAVVTGAASGIGRAIACRFAADGASVVVSDIRTDPIWDGSSTEPTADVIVSAGGSAVFHKADVSDRDDVDALIRRAVDEYGRLDIMVNNAGLVGSHNILETTEDEWDRLMDVNLRGQFLCCKRTIQQMVGQQPIGEVRGRVINIASQQGFIGPPDYFAYAVSKGGVVQMTRQLSTDYAKHGIPRPHHHRNTSRRDRHDRPRPCLFALPHTVSPVGPRRRRRRCRPVPRLR
jgi:glucose 1-dehydrogenase